MTRHQFLLFLAILMAEAIVGPSPARAQSAGMPVIGFLNIGSASAFATFLAAFHEGLGSTGYAERRNVAIEYRWADGDFKLLREQADDLVRRNVALIVASGGLVVAKAAKNATRTIPILFIGGGYPVDEGLVTSLNRPGGNATGVNLSASELITKRLQLLHELVPGTVKFAALLNPKTPSSHFERPDLESAGRETGLSLSILEASTEEELRKAFDIAASQKVGALVVSNDGFFTSRRGQIVELAAGHRLPVIYGTREYVIAGGLMSYGPSIPDAYRLIGEYTGRVLKGAKPDDLPVRLPTRFDFVVNLNTAKALDLTLPRTIYARANELIE
jgi:putative tryptophan/tyrosine transport system substrate-binding protein